MHLGSWSSESDEVSQLKMTLNIKLKFSTKQRQNKGDYQCKHPDIGWRRFYGYSSFCLCIDLEHKSKRLSRTRDRIKGIFNYLRRKCYS